MSRDSHPGPFSFSVYSIPPSFRIFDTRSLHKIHTYVHTYIHNSITHLVRARVSPPVVVRWPTRQSCRTLASSPPGNPDRGADVPRQRFPQPPPPLLVRLRIPAFAGLLGTATAVHTCVCLLRYLLKYVPRVEKGMPAFLEQGRRYALGVYSYVLWARFSGEGTGRVKADTILQDELGGER